MRKIQGLSKLVGSVVAVSLLAAACGSDDDSADTPEDTVAVETTSATDTTEPEATDPPATDAPEATTPAEGSTAGSAPASGETRTVEHALGTSEVPVDPQRVVVVDRRGTLPFMLELGVEPVGALEASWLFGEAFHPMISAQAEAAGVQPLDGTDGPPLEEIAALQPDLIIGNVRDMAETEDLLAQIAPTVGLEWNFSDPMQNAVTIGEAIGREEEAQALVDDFDAALAEAASSTTDPGTVSIIGLFAPDDIRIYRSGNLYGKLTEQLGGQIVPTEEELPLDPEDGEVNYVSLEEISMADGDRLISLVNLAAEEAAAYEDLSNESIVQALPGFQNDQVLVADPQLAFGAAGSTGIQAILDQLVEFYNS